MNRLLPLVFMFFVLDLQAYNIEVFVKDNTQKNINIAGHNIIFYIDTPIKFPTFSDKKTADRWIDNNIDAIKKLGLAQKHFIEKSFNYQLAKYPAVVFDKKFVFYGTKTGNIDKTTIIDMITKLQQYVRNN